MCPLQPYLQRSSRVISLSSGKTYLQWFHCHLRGAHRRLCATYLGEAHFISPIIILKWYLGTRPSRRGLDAKGGISKIYREWLQVDTCAFRYSFIRRIHISYNFSRKFLCISDIIHINHSLRSFQRHHQQIVHIYDKSSSPKLYRKTQTYSKRTIVSNRSCIW